MKHSIHRATVVIAAIAALAVPAAAQAKTTTLVGFGSSVAEPYLQKLFAGYKKVKPKVKFLFTADGGNAGAKDIQQGKGQFAVNTRPPLSSDSGLRYTQMFLDGLCIDVNTANSLADISTANLRDIFLGNLTNWSTIPGSNLNTTIDPVGRDSTAGTYTFFQSAVLNGKTQSSNVNAVGTDGLVATAVSNDPNAIGYVGFAHSRESGEKRLTLNGVTCEPKNVKNQSYLLSRYIWFITPADNPSPAAIKFLSWLRTSKAAGKILKKAGAVPAFNKK